MYVWLPTVNIDHIYGVKYTLYFSARALIKVRNLHVTPLLYAHRCCAYTLTANTCGQGLL